MKRFRWLALCILISGLFVDHGIVHAQQDVRLSPLAPASYIIPEDLRIQAAAQVDGRGLGVWGTYLAGDSGAMVRALVMQHMSGGVGVGIPIRLTDSIAQPYGAVGAVAIRDGYLVFWNDRAPGRGGINVATVGLDGTVRRRARSLALTPNALSYFITAGDPHRGQSIVWQTADGTIHVQYIDSTGGFDGSPTRLAAGTPVHLLGYASLPGPVFLRVGTTLTYMIGADGRIDGRVIPYGRLDLPFRFDGDSSFTCVVSNRLLRYATVFDKNPIDSISLSIVDSALPGGVVLTRNVSGQLVVYHLRRSVRDALVTFHLRRTTVDPNGGTLADEQLDSVGYVLQGWSYNDRISSTITNRFRLVGVDNAVRFAITDVNTWSRYHPSGYYTTTFSYGFVASDVSWQSGVPPVDTLAAGDWHPPVLRISYDTNSTIAVGSKGARLTIPIPPARLLRPHRSPGIFVDDGHLIVTWQQPNDKFRYVLGTVSPTAPFFRGVDSMNPYQIPERIRLDPYGRDYWEVLRYISSRHEFASCRENSSTIIVETDYLVDRGTAWPVYKYLLEFYRASASGWKLWTVGYEQPHNRFIYRRSWAVDPDHGSMLVFTTADYDSMFTDNLQLAQIDSLARLSGQLGMPFSEVHGHMVPISDTSVLAIENGQARYYIRGTLQRTFPMRSTTYDGYMRLYGGRVLVISPANADYRSFVLTAYDLDGNTSPTVTVQAPSADRWVSLVENPNDGSLAFLYVAADSRVHTTILRRDLTVSTSDSIISSADSKPKSPHGAYRGDSLFVVWEDTRDGEAAVYMSSLLPTGTVDRDPAEGDGGVPASTIGASSDGPTLAALGDTRISPVGIDPVSAAGIINDAGHLLVTWWRHGIGNPFLLSEFDPLTLEVRTFDSLEHHGVADLPDTRQHVDTFDIRHIDNVTVATASRSGRYPHSSGKYIEYASLLACRASRGGWAPGWEQTIRNYDSLAVAEHFWTADPDNRTVLLTFQLAGTAGATLDLPYSTILLDATGARTGNMVIEQNARGITLLPVSPTEVLSVYGAMGRIYRSYNRFDSVHLPLADAGRDVTYRRLAGARILGLMVDTARRTIRLGVVDTTDRSYGQTSLSVDAVDGYVSYVENDSDGSVTLLFVAPDERVHAAVVNRDLSIRTRDTVVSSSSSLARHPVGAYRDDTLYVVWEDRRDGASAAYINAMHPIGPRSAVDSRGGANGTSGGLLSLTPMPADARIRVQWNASTGPPRDLIVHDVLGRAVIQHALTESDRHQATLDVDARDLPDGLYVVALTFEDHIVSQPLIILHR